MMKFLCDAMLGKLARWLRIMGYDTVLATTQSDSELLWIANSEDRILLTRDASIPGVHVPEELFDQLVFLAREVGLEIPVEPRPKRCPVCNGELVPTKEGLPEGVNHGWKCTKCGKLYWEGSHWKRMRQFLTRVKKEVESEKSTQVNNLNV